RAGRDRAGGNGAGKRWREYCDVCAGAAATVARGGGCVAGAAGWQSGWRGGAEYFGDFADHRGVLDPAAGRSGGERGRSVVLVEGQMVGFHLAAEVVEGFVHRIGELQQLVVAMADGARKNHVLPVDDPVPVLAAVDQD